jgi:hypothetical protein
MISIARPANRMRGKVCTSTTSKAANAAKIRMVANQSRHATR